VFAASAELTMHASQAGVLHFFGDSKQLSELFPSGLLCWILISSDRIVDETLA